MAQYSAILEKLRGKISQALPSVDPGLKHPFMRAYRAESKFVKPPFLRSHAYAQALSRCQSVAAPILSIVDPVLSSRHLDKWLVEASVIADATPRGLAAFAQKSKANEDLIRSMLADPALMKQMQMADGARNGNYGLTMQIYKAIRHASPLAKKGVFQRLALATALIQRPSMAGWDEHKFKAVARYMNFQNAYLAKELDPVFPTLSVWEFRFVVNDPFSNREISWFRKMMMNYAPAYVLSGHYIDIVHTDVGYIRSPRWGTFPGDMAEQIVESGGECGPRAWYGRLAERAFGIPAWGVKQRGHAALTHWTRDGWVTRFSAGWDWIWWKGTSGINFYLESQARRYPADFMKVLRAQWIGSVLGEQKPDLWRLGTGGFWFAVANSQERAIIASGKPADVTPTNARLAALYGPTLAQKLRQAHIAPSAMRVSVNNSGVITIPAVAFKNASGPRGKKVGLIIASKSFSGGMQLYYQIGQPSGNKHQPIEYVVDAPAAGRYELVAEVDSVKAPENMTVAVNHGKASVKLIVPWTAGMWQDTKPVEVTLAKGKNTLTFDKGKSDAYSAKFIYALSIKKFVLTPQRHAVASIR
ncbi:MAG: hypothetical protein ACP5QA_04680 [Phycisphaerae bacterium]